jgi:hypothetical protein
MHSIKIQDAPISRPSSSPWRAGRKMLAIAVVLWIASNVFVSSIAKFSTWESNGAYGHMADLCKWDCNWFGSVLESGYDRTPARSEAQANWLFHPLLPIAAFPLNRWLGLSRSLSLVIVGKLAFLGSIYAFLLMISGELHDPTDYVRAGALVAFNPYLIYGHAGYSEPFYFGSLCLAFYFAQKRSWMVSGCMGALVSAARMVGFLFSAAFFLIAFREWRRRMNR